MIQIFEEDERVSRDGHELALDTAAKRAAARLFARVGAYMADGVVQYPRAGTIAFSWLQKSAHADHETWVARAEISFHPPAQVVENPHAVPMDNRINEQAGES
jgi:TPR repeat protein